MTNNIAAHKIATTPTAAARINRRTKRAPSERTYSIRIGIAVFAVIAIGYFATIGFLSFMVDHGWTA